MERRRRGPRIARSLAEATAAAAARAPDLGVGEFARGDLEHAAEDGAQVVALERVLALAAVTLEEDLETRAERRGLEAPANALQLVVAEPPRALGDDELPREPEPLEPRLSLTEAGGPGIRLSLGAGAGSARGSRLSGRSSAASRSRLSGMSAGRLSRTTPGERDLAEALIPDQEAAAALTAE